MRHRLSRNPGWGTRRNSHTSAAPSSAHPIVKPVPFILDRKNKRDEEQDSHRPNSANSVFRAGLSFGDRQHQPNQTGQARQRQNGRDQPFVGKTRICMSTPR
jgi:hypothetical protein